MHLVTGGAGFIGSHLVDRLVSKGEKVRVIDNLSSGRIDFIEGHIGNSVEIIIADLLDIDRLSDAMEGVTISASVARVIFAEKPSSIRP